MIDHHAAARRRRHLIYPRGAKRLGGSPICLVAIQLPSLLLLIGALPFWDALSHHAGVQSVLRGVKATVVGILIGALYTPAWTSANFAPAVGDG